VVLLFLFLPLFGEAKSIPFETKEAPTGVRLTKVLLYDFQAGSRTRVDVEGRFSGFEDGKVRYEFNLKNTGRVIGTHEGWIKLIRNEKFSVTFYVDIHTEPANARAFFKFGEFSDP